VAEIDLEPPKNSRYLNTRWKGALEACGDEIALTIRSGGSVQGSVTDLHGKALPDLPLTIRGTKVSGKTEADGSFLMEGIGAGKREIVVDPRYATRAQEKLGLMLSKEGKPSGPAEVDITAGETELEWELIAVSGGTICVDVASAIGDPLPSLSVSAFAERSQQAARVVELRSGRYRNPVKELCLDGLLPGTYVIWAESFDKGYAGRWWPGRESRDQAEHIAVSGGDEQRFQLELPLVGDIQLMMDASGDPPAIDSIVWVRRVEEDRALGPWEPVAVEKVSRTTTEKGYALSVRQLEVGEWLVRVCPFGGCEEGGVFESSSAVLVKHRQETHVPLLSTDRLPARRSAQSGVRSQRDHQQSPGPPDK
jgi:hypothetical protein